MKKFILIIIAGLIIYLCGFFILKNAENKLEKYQSLNGYHSQDLKVQEYYSIESTTVYMRIIGAVTIVVGCLLITVFPFPKSKKNKI